MKWIPYKTWSGGVLGKQVRVPLSYPSFVTCYFERRGYQPLALNLRAGAVGTLIQVLEEGTTLHGFSKPIDLTYAIEFEVRQSENSEVMWKDFANAYMPDGQATVVITKKLLILWKYWLSKSDGVKNFRVTEALNYRGRPPVQILPFARVGRRSVGW